MMPDSDEMRNVKECCRDQIVIGPHDDIVYVCGVMFCCLVLSSCIWCIGIIV